jgi:ribosome-associated protein
MISSQLLGQPPAQLTHAGVDAISTDEWTQHPGIIAGQLWWTRLPCPCLTQAIADDSAPRMSSLSARHLAIHLGRALDDKGAEDLSILELLDGQIADFVIITTGRSDRQVHAIADEAEQFCKRHKISHHPREGDSGWTLLDCGDVVVHALTEELRQFYRLERLWPTAKRMDWQTEAATLPRLKSGAGDRS